MRHRNAGFKLGRNTSHRRALLRNLVTSVHRRRPRRDHRGQGQGGSSARRKNDHARQKGRSALAPSGAQLPDDRQGGDPAVRHRGPALRRSPGRLSPHRPHWISKGDGAEKAFIELLGAEKQLEVKRQKRADIKAKKRQNWKSSSKLQKKKKRAAKKLPRGLAIQAVFLRSQTPTGASFHRRRPFFAPSNKPSRPRPHWLAGNR